MALLAHEASWSHLESKFLCRFSEVIEHDVDYGNLLHFGRVDFQDGFLVALPCLEGGKEEL